MNRAEVEEPDIIRAADRADMVDTVGRRESPGRLADDAERRLRQLHRTESAPDDGAVAPGVRVRSSAVSRFPAVWAGTLHEGATPSAFMKRELH